MGGTGLEPVTPACRRDRWRFVRFRPFRFSWVEPACQAAFGRAPGRTPESDGTLFAARSGTGRHCPAVASASVSVSAQPLRDAWDARPDRVQAISSGDSAGAYLIWSV